MDVWCGVILATGLYPLARAWQANRQTALRDAVLWTIGAWAAWVVARLLPAWSVGDTAPWRYLALCLTCGAIVAVLGARRPGVAAWNFVVVGFLAITLLPLAENQVRGGSYHPGWMRAVPLIGVVTVGFLNYLPTRLGPAALCVALGAFAEILGWTLPQPAPALLDRLAPPAQLFFAFSPWVGLVGVLAVRQPTSQFDRLWLGFRDRFGLLWSQRLRDQFNRSADNAGWPVLLYWQGLYVIAGHSPPGPAEQEAILDALRALMKRFMSDR